MDAFPYLAVLNIPAVVMLGIVTSYQDLKQGKIKNGWIAIAIAYSLFTLGLASGLLALQGWSINTNYITVYFINIFTALGFGVLLWVAKLWSAGDAKLFVAYAALIPLSIYRWLDMPSFPAYTILINTFTPIFVFLGIRLLFQLKPKEAFKDFKAAFKPTQLLSIAVFMFGFSWIASLVFSFSGLRLSMIAGMLVLVPVLIVLRKLLKDKLVIASCVFSAVRLVMDFRLVLSLGFWLGFLLNFLVFFIFLYFILNVAHRSFSRQVYIEQLKEGMCLAEDVYKDKDGYKLKSRLQISLVQSISDSADESKSIFNDHTCLSEEDVKRVNKLHSEGKLTEHSLLVYDKVSFAVFMFAGALITIVFGGDFLFAAAALLEKFI